MFTQYRKLPASLLLALCSIGVVLLLKSALFFLLSFVDNISIIVLVFMPYLIAAAVIIAILLPAFIVKLIFQIPLFQPTIKRPFLWSTVISSLTLAILIGAPLVVEHQEYIQEFPETKSSQYDFSKPAKISIGQYDKRLIGIQNNNIVWIERTKNTPPDRDNLLGLFLLKLDPLTSKGTTIKLLETGSIYPNQVIFDQNKVYWIEKNDLILYDIKSQTKDTFHANVDILFGVFNNKVLVKKHNDFKNETQLFWYDLQTKEYAPLEDDIADIVFGVTMQENFLCYATVDNKMKQYDLESGHSISFDLGQNNGYTPKATDCRKDYIVYKKNISINKPGTPANVLYAIYDTVNNKQIFEKLMVPGIFDASYARLVNNQFQYINEKYPLANEKYKITSLNLTTHEETPLQYFIMDDMDGNYKAYAENIDPYAEHNDIFVVKK